MNNFKHVLYSFLFLLCLSFSETGCSIDEKKPNFILDHQPNLKEIVPSTERLPSLSEIELHFSTELDPSSVHSDSIFLIKGDIFPAEKIEKVEGILLIKDLQTIVWNTTHPLIEGNYTLVVTSQLKGVHQIPFNQTPGKSPSSFTHSYTLSTFHSNTEIETQKSSNKPVFLMIHEIFYDPSGSESDGNTFIELYGTPDGDLEGYQLNIINGEDGKILKNLTFPVNSILNKEGIFLISDAKNGDENHSNILFSDWIENFDLQNAPDSVQLLNEKGELLDAVSYGNGGKQVASNGLATVESRPAEDVKEGASLSRKNGVDTQNNEADFIETAPSPGKL